MAEIINLRQARKRKRRAAKEDEASTKRVTHGQSATAKANARLLRGLSERRLESHRRETSASDEPDG